jgi:extradiol dioxygenase family protein
VDKIDMKITPFHLAIPVHDIEIANNFYTNVLRCEKGRCTDTWADFNLYGHQLVCHEVQTAKTEPRHNPVDGHEVPVPHFGVVLEMAQWQELRDHLLKNAVEFIIEPYIRFAGEAGEQATMFFLDPSGNAIEFKAFSDIDNELFKSD